MNIEIAENLIYSYLKHVEGCRIIQTNWKTSNQWKITEYEEESSRKLFDKIATSNHFHGIFKNNSFEQLIKQAEIDVIGLNTIEKSIYGIDVAFHKAGLNYGSAQETSLRVLKKILRSVFIMQTFFGDFDKVNSYFVTPKVNRSTEGPIRNLLEKANEIIGDDMISIDFIANETFYSSLVDSTIENIDDDNDTSELFLRSMKLIRLDKRIRSSNSKSGANKSEPIDRTIKREVDGMKIGQFVQYSMRKAYEQNVVSQDELLRLQGRHYSKKVFDQNFEILRGSAEGIIGPDGRNRYYSKEKFFGNFFLTSQWVEKHWEPFLKWLNRVNRSHELT